MHLTSALRVLIKILEENLTQSWINKWNDFKQVNPLKPKDERLKFSYKNQ